MKRRADCFEKVNKTDKRLERLTKKEREKTPIFSI